MFYHLGPTSCSLEEILGCPFHRKLTDVAPNDASPLTKNRITRTRWSTYTKEGYTHWRTLSVQSSGPQSNIINLYEYLKSFRSLKSIQFPKDFQYRKELELSKDFDRWIAVRTIGQSVRTIPRCFQSQNKKVIRYYDEHCRVISYRHRRLGHQTDSSLSFITLINGFRLVS